MKKVFLRLLIIIIFIILCFLAPLQLIYLAVKYIVSGDFHLGDPWSFVVTSKLSEKFNL